MKRMVVACALAAAGFGLFAAETFELAPGAKKTFAADGKGARRLKVKARLALDQGEKFASYALKLSVDGKPFAAKPFNVEEAQYDLYQKVLKPTPRFDAATGAWLVHEDFDFVPYNWPVPPASGWWNFFNVGPGRDVWQNQIYDYIFDLPGGAKSVSVENVSKTLKLVGELAVYPTPAYPVFFQRAVGENIFPFAELKPEEQGIGKLTAYACRGERATLVLSVKTDRDEKWTWTTEGLPAPDIRPLGHTPWVYSRPDVITPRCLRFYYGGHETLQFPDVLTANHEWSVPKGEASSLWIMFDVPKTQKSGLLKGAITLRDAAGKSRRFAVEVEVPDFDLPTVDRIYGMYTDYMPSLGNMEYTHRQGKDLKEHGINTLFVEPWSTRIPVAEDGTPDLKNLEKTLDILKEYGFNEKLFIFGLCEPIFDQLNVHVAKKVNAEWEADEKAGRHKKTAKKGGKVELDLNAEVANDELDETMQDARAGSLKKIDAEAARKARLTAKYPFTNKFWAPLAKKTFTAIGDCIAKRGYDPYFTSVDEPDTNGGMAQFTAFADFMTKETKYKVASNLQVPTYYKYRDQVKFNICNGLARGQDVKDGKGNVIVPKAWVDENCYALYRQSRSFDPLGNRLFFGFRCDHAGYRAVWGFSYFQNEKWKTANPVKEADGRCGTTPGWEAVRMGIDDSRYYAYLESIAPGEGLKILNELVPHGWRYSAEDIQHIRDRIYAKIREVKGK